MEHSHIALALHNRNNYFIHGLTTLESVCSFSQRPVLAHIIHDDTLGEIPREYFRTLAAAHGATVKFHNLGDIYKRLPKSGGLEKFSPACLYRLHAPGLAAPHPVLYLDCDVCAQADPDLFFKSRLSASDKAVWAVADTVLARSGLKKYSGGLVRDAGKYFNSGVLHFNSAKVEAMFPNLFDRAISMLEKNPDLSFPDQDILNILFAEKDEVALLTSKANFQMTYKKRRELTPEKLEGRIIHYSWHKPWEYAYPAGLVYWRHRQNAFRIISERALPK